MAPVSMTPIACQSGHEAIVSENISVTEVFSAGVHINFTSALAFEVNGAKPQQPVRHETCECSSDVIGLPAFHIDKIHALIHPVSFNGCIRFLLVFGYPFKHHSHFFELSDCKDRIVMNRHECLSRRIALGSRVRFSAFRDRWLVVGLQCISPGSWLWVCNVFHVRLGTRVATVSNSCPTHPVQHPRHVRNLTSWLCFYISFHYPVGYRCT